MSFINVLALAATMAATTSAQTVGDEMQSFTDFLTAQLNMLIQEQASLRREVETLTAELMDVNAELDEVMNEKVIEDHFYKNNEDLDYNLGLGWQCFEPTSVVAAGQTIDVNAYFSLRSYQSLNNREGIHLRLKRNSDSQVVAWGIGSVLADTNVSL